MPMTKPTSEQVTFLAAGTGASQRTVLDKLRDVVSVKDFGAVGDGVADDTAAFVAAAARIQTQGGGTFLIPPGTYKVLPTIAVTNLTQTWMFQFTGLNGVRIVATGATINDGNTYNVSTNTAVSTNGNLFLFHDCVNVQIVGMRMTAQQNRAAGDTSMASFGGSNCIQLTGTTRNVEIDIDMDGGCGCVRCQASSYSSSARVSNIHAHIRVNETVRPYAGAFTGDDAVVDVVGTYVARGALIYGVKNQRLNVRVQNEYKATVIAAIGGYGCENVELWYYNRGSSEQTAVGGVDVDWQDTTPATHRNIRIHLNSENISGRTSSAFSTSLNLRKYDGSMNPDPVGRGHVLDGLWVDGISEQPSGVQHIETIGTFASPDVQTNINISSMTLLGGNNAGNNNLWTALAGPATYTNVYCPSNRLTIESGAAGQLQLVNCTAQRFTNNTSDSSVATYVGGTIIDSTGQSAIGKAFIDTKIGSWRRTILPTLNVGGGAVRTTKALSGDLTGTNNIFLVRKTTDLIYFRLKYALVADRLNVTTGQTIGIKSFTNYMNSSGTWNVGASTLIAVANEVTERTTGTASAITVSFVNGTTAGAYIAVSCTNYNGSGARAMFELEAICTVQDELVPGTEVIVQPA